jgi:hypothetical protein
MQKQAEQSPESINQSVANSLSSSKGNNASTYQFVDNRPVAVAQRRLQQMADQSAQVRQLRAFQEMANTSQQRNAAQVQLKKNSQGIIQRKCAACEHEDAVQRIKEPAPVQLKGTQTECEAYHADYKSKPAKKCTQNNTKAEMEANVISTQAHIDGRQKYLDEECDTVLPGSIAKGSDVALASHQVELANVKRTLATCNDKITNHKYKT